MKKIIPAASGQLKYIHDKDSNQYKLGMDFCAKDGTHEFVMVRQIGPNLFKEVEIKPRKESHNCFEHSIDGGVCMVCGKDTSALASQLGLNDE